MRTTGLERWQFFYEGRWRDAVVPGCIHLDLLRHGLIEDPFVRQNEKDCQWVDERDWSYRCVFDWKPDADLSFRVLFFAGLDTVCSVFLNGELIAEHDNMFRPLYVVLSERRKAGTHELRVDFQSASRVGRQRRAAYLAEQGLPEDVPNFDERAFVRKAQYMFGWDWAPRLVSCGIWKPVQLLEAPPSVESGPADIERPVARAKLVQRPDEWGRSFKFEVDGRPFYALGANWIPDHSFPSKVTPDRLGQRLTTAKEMGINMLRVWGGGLYESDEFYDLCDELGILIWQDFMFACSYYPDTPEWQEKIRHEAEHQVKRLRRHPCIALWCGNNECHQVWQDGWGGKDKQPPRFHGEILYHEVLREVVERLDPGRAYVPGSPFGGEYCNQGGVGDQHYWEVWHGKGDWTHYKDSTARFCSEFGFASSPSPETWRRAGVEANLPPEHEDARWHNKTGKPFEVFRDLVELHYPRAATLEEWSNVTQLNQRDAMRAAIEHFRFSGFCRGTLIWQLNDCWPA
ncbi:MAG: beta-mannosidase, partial [Fimbriimonadaceae bacterium]|nr:beta-mannosidase [Fimbriimonadaceae bacterium]